MFCKYNVFNVDSHRLHLGKVFVEDTIGYLLDFIYFSLNL